MKKIIIIAIAIAVACGIHVMTTGAASCIRGQEGGTGICATTAGNVGKALIVSSTGLNGAVTWTLGASGSSGGGGTTTINGLTANPFLFLGAGGLTISTSSTSTITFTQTAGGSSSTGPFVRSVGGLVTLATTSDSVSIGNLSSNGLFLLNPFVIGGQTAETVTPTITNTTGTFDLAAFHSPIFLGAGNMISGVGTYENPTYEGSGKIGDVTGIVSFPSYQGTGSATDVTGFSAQPSINTQTSTVTNETGIGITLDAGGSAVSSTYGVHIFTPLNTASAVRMYGIKIENQPTSSFSLFTGSGTASFGDSVGIGTGLVAPSTTLQVAGTFEQSSVVSSLGSFNSVGKLTTTTFGGQGLSFAGNTLTWTNPGFITTSTFNLSGTAFNIPYWNAAGTGLSPTSSIFYASSTGFVGISSTTFVPGAPLHVSNSYTAPGGNVSGNTAMLLTNDTTAFGSVNESLLSRSNGTSSLNFGDQSAEVRGFVGYNAASGTLSLGTEGLQRLMVASTGRVAIGTSTASGTFNIAGTSAISPLLVSSSTGAPMMTILSNGNVAVGTTTTSNAFTVSSPSSTNFIESMTTVASNPIAGFQMSSNAHNWKMALQGNSGNEYTWSFDGVNEARLTSGGFYAAGPSVGLGGSALSADGGLAVGAGFYTTAAPTNGAIVQGNMAVGSTTANARFDVVGTFQLEGSSTVITPQIGGAIVSGGCDSATSSVDSTVTSSTAAFVTTARNNPNQTLGGTWAYTILTSPGIISTFVCSNITVTPATTDYVIKILK